MGNTKPLVSIIVRTKDRPILLRKALQSIAAQTYRPIEVVLVNDGGCSLDLEDLKSILADVSLQYTFLEKNKGRATAGNIGIECARGTYMGFLDDDDEFYSEHISVLVKILGKYDYKVAYTDADITFLDFDPEIAEIVAKTKRLFSSRDFSYKELLIDNYMPLICLLFSRDLFQEFHGFDENFEIYEDWDLLIRIAEKYPFYHARKKTVNYIQWSNTLQISQTPAFVDKANAAHMQIIKKHKEKFTPEVITSLVHSRRSVTDKDGYIDDLTRTVQEHYGQITKLNNMCQEREDSVVTLEQTMNEMKGHIFDLEKTIQEREGRMTDLKRTVEERDAHAKNLEKTIQEQEGNLFNFSVMIRQKEGHIADLEKEFHEHEGFVANLKKTLQEKEVHSLNLERTIQERDNLITNLGKIIQEREVISRDLEKAFQTQKNQISGFESILSERDNRISELGKVLQEKDAIVQRLGSKIKTAENHILDLERTVRERETEISGIGKKLYEREERISDFENIIREREEQIAGLVNTINAKDGSILELREASLEKDNRITSLEGTIREKDVSLFNLERIKATLDRAVLEQETALNKIFYSRGYKGLSFYYKMRDTIFPFDTKRQALMKSSVEAAVALLKKMKDIHIKDRGTNVKSSSPVSISAKTKDIPGSITQKEGEGVSEMQNKPAHSAKPLRDKKTQTKKGTVLVTGVYLANQENFIEHVVSQLNQPSSYEVIQKWIALFGDAPSENVKAVTVLNSAEPQPKFVLLNKILSGEKLEKYDYIVICDDDIQLSNDFLDDFLNLQQQYDFALAQPARSHKSYIDHPFVEQFDGLKARRTRFIEIGPVVSLRKDVFSALLPFDESCHMGWGYDFVWPCIIEKMGLRMGIIDAVPVDHSLRKPVKYYDYDETDKSMKAYLSRNAHLSKEEAFTILESYA